MPIEFLQNAIKLLKFNPKYAFSTLLVSGPLLFLDEENLRFLMLEKFKSEYGFLLGFIFLTSTATLTVYFSSIFISKLTSSLRRMQRRKTIKNYLQNLTEEEKKILRFYINKKTKTNLLLMTDGVATGLINQGILYIASSVGDMLNGHATNIADFAYKFLITNPELLKGETNLESTRYGIRYPY